MNMSIANKSYIPNHDCCNPATHYVEFYYELSEIDTEGIITITDINGKLIQTFSVKYERGKQAWDTRKIPSGSYLFFNN